MRYFLVVLFFALWQAILARELHDNPVLYDFERRLVRLEDRQFSESQNLEHRLLQMEVQLGTQTGDEKFVPLQLDSHSNNVNEAKEVQYPSFDEFKEMEKLKKMENIPSFDDLKLLEKLEKMEKNWEKDLQEELSKFSSKYDNLEEKLSEIEKQVKETIGSAEIDHDISSSRHLFKKIGEKYYRIEQENTLGWRDALRKCISQNAKLASLQNEEEWDAIRDYLESDKSYWVDVNDIVREGNYVSGTSRQKAPFLKWHASEPNQLSVDEDCVELRRDYDHYMNDIICSQENYYICELNPDYL